MAMHQPVCKQCEDYGFVHHNGEVIECPMCTRCEKCERGLDFCVCGTGGRELTMAEVLGYQQVYDYVAEMTGDLNKWLKPGDAHHAHALGIEIA